MRALTGELGSMAQFITKPQFPPTRLNPSPRREGRTILAMAGGSITDHKSPSLAPSLPEVEKPAPLPPARLQEKPKRVAYQLRLPLMGGRSWRLLGRPEVEKPAE